MSKVEQALKAALAALDLYDYTGTQAESELYAKAETQCKAALAELEKCEPVGIINQFPKVDRNLYKRADITWDRVNDGDLLYTSPQPKEWVGLSDDELKETFNSADYKAMVTIDDVLFIAARAIEAKLKELNT